MSLITQDGDSALTKATRRGENEVVSVLKMAASSLDLDSKVKMSDVTKHCIAQ